MVFWVKRIFYISVFYNKDKNFIALLKNNQNNAKMNFHSNKFKHTP